MSKSSGKTHQIEHPKPITLIISAFMPAGVTYPHAPITEALIDFRVTFKSPPTPEQLREFGKKIKTDYPNEVPRYYFQAQFAPSQQPTTSTELAGYIWHSVDRLQAVQLRVDGFTFSRFKPYKDWNQLASEARRLWLLVISQFPTDSVNRIAVRYINQLNLPNTPEGLRLEQYLRTYPHLTDDMADVVGDFFMRFVLPQADLQAQLVLIEALLPAENPDNTTSVVFDVDLFREQISMAGNSPEIWDILEAFRTRKNQYFECSITDAARELFK